MMAKILMENKNTKEIKQTVIGFSWTYLLFGFFVPLLRSDCVWFLFSFLIFFFVYPLLILIFFMGESLMRYMLMGMGLETNSYFDLFYFIDALPLIIDDFGVGNLISLPFTFVVFIFLSIRILFATVYNKKYVQILISKGYVPHDELAKNKLAKIGIIFNSDVTNGKPN